jgi:AcrR family transcriptional regulator
MGAMSEEVKRRTYASAGRQAKSAQTRQRIVDAARQQILSVGYRATTIAAVAAEADVSVDTVYELVGRKPVLLRELIEQAISGTDHAVTAMERDYVRAMRIEADPARMIALYARAMRDIQPRLAPLFIALRDASATDPEAGDVWQEINQRRAKNMHQLAADLRRRGGLRSELTIGYAADVIWAMNSPELYVLLTGDRGWSARRFESWLADSLCRLLLDCGSSAP